MAFLLLPSKHWLIALAPLTVACAALVSPGEDSGLRNIAQKPNSTPTIKEESLKEIVKERPRKEPVIPVTTTGKSQPNPGKTVEYTNWQSMHGELRESVRKLDEELVHRQYYIREMQKHIEASLKRMDLKKIRDSTRIEMQHNPENIDFNEIELINHANNLLDSNKAELKRLVRTEARNIEQAKEQLRSYREMLYEMRRMAYRKSGRFNIDID